MRRLELEPLYLWQAYCSLPPKVAIIFFLTSCSFNSNYALQGLHAYARLHVLYEWLVQKECNKSAVLPNQ